MKQRHNADWEIAGNASTRLEEGQRCVRSLVERHQIGHVVGTTQNDVWGKFAL